ncbi:hypothetical protein GCM10011316_09100 [Roseibium aquae]|uniref:DUF1513 domain-containing protein n=1 Tax=Roseibium aquae TaxID=1323746 RepID=A0A916TDB4_9HYPH|nr:DUF1513 domain-containing protein [Roseibium aquae]GGB39242.1 hypothetical protein GCM10011316_09100 [Roseibium aquae]
MPLTATERLRISRRAFLAALGGASLLANPASSTQAFAEHLAWMDRADAPLFASARKQPDGSFAIAVFDDSGRELARVPLPDRGHGLALSPDRQVMVAFARRPGTFALAIRPFTNASPRLISSIQGRHFYGHGCFSGGGRFLYTVENDYENARGVLGVYDMTDESPRRLGELDTFGTGPHDILALPDGKTLVVANGGIQTHPDRPREKLNLGTMRPSIVFLDAATGDLRAKHELTADLHQLSLRHMALDGAGRVWVGGQHQDKTASPPLVGFVSPDRELTLCPLPDRFTGLLDNYIGSVTANRTGDVIATSAPRGNRILFWNAETGNFIPDQTVPDGCGIAPIDRDGFLVSDGLGGLTYLDAPDSQPLVLSRPPGVAWDNHLFAL